MARQTARGYFPAPTADIRLGKQVFGEFVPWGNPQHTDFFPMRGEALEWLKKQWTGWQRTGMRLSYRPNYLHDGWVMPLVDFLRPIPPLAWVEKKALGDKRVVVVKVPVADVLAAGDPAAKSVFRVEQNVLLELLEPPASGWARVRHRDGQTGFIAISQVWGL